MKSLKYIATLLIVVLVLSACSNNKSLYSDDGQVFRKVITQDISTLDTALITDAVSGDIAKHLKAYIQLIKAIRLL